jgi:hypothetical protein
MRSANLKGVPSFIKKRPVTGRLLTLGWLIAMPAIVVGHVVLYAVREVIPCAMGEMKQMLGVIFLPWDSDQ